MAKNFIKIDRTTQTAVYAMELLSLVGQLRATLNQIDKIKGIADANWATTDFVDFEALFGIPTGQGATVYALIRDSREALRGLSTQTAALTLIDRVG
jgi:hypothetical protein